MGRSATFLAQNFIHNGGLKVKTTLLSALLIVSVLSPINVAPTQAASLVITTDNGSHMGRHHWRDHRWHKHHNRHCFVKVRKHWRHHHWVIEKVRVCDFDRF